MSFRDFIPHLGNVLDQLGMSLHARTNFIKCVFCLATTEPTLTDAPRGPRAATT